MDVVELVGEEPGVFRIVDFEVAIWGDTGGVSATEVGKREGESQFWLDGTQVCSYHICPGELGSFMAVRSKAV